jgi:hypothetical protein
LVEIVAKKPKEQKLQSCLILNDAYPVMKNEETRPDPILNQTFLKQIPNFPSIVVGRESGFGENKLFNLLDDT